MYHTGHKIKEALSVPLLVSYCIPALSKTTALLCKSQSDFCVPVQYSPLSSIFSTLRIPASYESRQHALQSWSIVASIQCPSCTPSFAKEALKERVCRNNFIVSIAGSLVILPPIPHSTIPKRPGECQVFCLLQIRRKFCNCDTGLFPCVTITNGYGVCK